MAFTVVAGAQERWVAFSDDKPFSEARMEASRSGSDRVEFDLVIPGVAVEQITTAQGEFTRLAIPGMGRIGDIGAPELPAFRRFVEIPQGATAVVTTSVLDRATLTLETESLPGLIYPVQLPMPKCDCAEARAWTFSHETKLYKGVVGADATGLKGPYTIRDHNMMMLTAAPAAYNVDAGTVEIATRLRVTVDIAGGDAAKTAAVKERLSSRHFDAWLANAAINVNMTEAGGWAYPDDAPVEFLIITPPQFVTDLAPFVEWKTSTGYNMNVVTTNETGTSTDDIKTYIEGLYAGLNPPVYILMIGDSPTPLDTYTFSSSHGGWGGTDLPFVQMDADYYPDMMIARWPIDDSTELANMRDKILFYEQPTAANSAWLNRALYLAGDGYVGWPVTTHEEVMAELMEPAPNSAECDLWYDADNPTTNELIADLNTGRAWMVYSGHCGPSEIGGAPSFHSSDVPDLANSNEYPMGIGHCCQSNMWANYDDVFGEVMVIQPDKGFVSYWGTSNSSTWDEDDWLEKAYFDAFFDDDVTGVIGDWDGLYTNIAACYAGLSEVTLQGLDEEKYWYMYNLNGDPTLDPFTKFPIALNVGAPDVVPPVADTFTVTVTDENGAVPVAMVGVTQSGVLLGAGFTDATGAAVFPIDAPVPGSDLLVRVTAHNHLPTDAATLVAAGSDGVVVLDGDIYRCDSPVVINVFDEDLDTEPPFNVTLSASPSGGSIPVQVTNLGTPGVVQFQGGAVLGTDLVAAHGDTLTVTYMDANTGTKTPGTKTDTAVVDCQAPVISAIVTEETSSSVTVSFDTDEDGTTEVVWGTSKPPTTVVSSSALSTSHQVTIDGLDPCTMIYFELRSTDALGNTRVDDNGGAYYRTGTINGPYVAGSTDTPLAIPDSTPGGVTSAITVDSTYTVLDVDVRINITHSWDSDLDITLIAPDGTRVELTSDNGSWDDDYIDTVFDDDATTSIVDGAGPFTGSFRPEQPLVVLNELPAAGIWSLEVVDDASSDTGTLNSWDLMLTIDKLCSDLFNDDFESGNCSAWSLESPAP